MKNEFLIHYRLRIALALLLAPFACAAFWYLTSIHRVYDSALVGALFEKVWFPAMLITFGTPVLSVICLVKDKRKFKSIFLPIAFSSILVLIWTMNL